MSVNATAREPGTDASVQNNAANEGEGTIMVEKPVEPSDAGLPSTAHSRRPAGGTRVLVAGAWILVVVQVLATAQNGIDAHARNPSIEAFLSIPTCHNIASALGHLIGTTLPGAVALVAGLTLYRRSNHRNGRSLSVLAALAVALMVGLQFMPTFSLGGGRDLSAPSNRLAGLWKDENGMLMNYGPTDSLGMGTCHDANGSIISTFKILSEDRSGTKVAMREYANGVALWDAEYSVSKDSRSMTKEYILEDGHRLLSEFRRVDVDQTALPAQAMKPAEPDGPIPSQRSSGLAWGVESEVPPPIEVSFIVNVGGKPEAGVEMDNPSYSLDRLREGCFISGYETAMTDQSDIGTLRPFVTPWRVIRIDSDEIRVEKQEKTWVHKVGGGGWEPISNHATHGHALGLP